MGGRAGGCEVLHRMLPLLLQLLLPLRLLPLLLLLSSARLLLVSTQAPTHTPHIPLNLLLPPACPPCRR